MKSYMSVFSLSMSVISLPRPYLPKFGSHTFLLNWLVSEPYIVCFLVAGFSRTLSKYKTGIRMNSYNGLCNMGVFISSVFTRIDPTTILDTVHVISMMWITMRTILFLVW